MYRDRGFSLERPKWDEMIHDMTVQKIAENLRKKGLDVRANQGSSKHNSIRVKNKTCLPDIYIMKDRKVVNIYEVETPNSVNEEAVEKWKSCQEGCSSLYLIVPKDKLRTTKRLAKKNNVKVKDFITYNLNK
jgi:hypothetical protein